MVEAVGNIAANTAFRSSTPAAHDAAADQESTQVAELVAAAIARMRRDMEKYHPNDPAIAYAFVGETHGAMTHQWRQYPADAQIALLAALQKEAVGLLHQLQAPCARIALTNGYMYGLQDEAIKLETQAEIAIEEIHRIEAELHALSARDALHALQ